MRPSMVLVHCATYSRPSDPSRRTILNDSVPKGRPSRVYVNAASSITPEVWAATGAARASMAVTTRIGIMVIVPLSTFAGSRFRRWSNEDFSADRFVDLAVQCSAFIGGRQSGAPDRARAATWDFEPTPP